MKFMYTNVVTAHEEVFYWILQWDKDLWKRRIGDSYFLSGRRPIGPSYFLCSIEPSLLFLSCLELHVWGTRIFMSCADSLVSG